MWLWSWLRTRRVENSETVTYFLKRKVAIAYDSKQFTSGEFFMYGIPASLILMAVVALAILVIWPLLGMPITVPRTM